VNEQRYGSEFARLRQQIRLEYEAAQQGLHGLAQGSTQHAFITSKMENMATCYTALKELVGERDAMALFVETLGQDSNSSS
jgi:hypothetical protein